MKVLITGGNGFVARNIRDQLGEKYEITAVGRAELDLMEAGKVRDFLKKGKFEVVIHTATYDAVAVGSTKDPNKVLENNLRMFFNVARNSGEFGRMIYFGSGAEFGRENWKPKMDEDYFDFRVPTDQYGYSKYLMTKYAERSENIYCLRLFGNFGRYDDWKTRLIPNVCYRVIKNIPVEINQNKFYDFLYINDLVMMVEWLMMAKRPKHHVYNACSGETRDFEAVAKMIVGFSERDEGVKVVKEGLGTEYSGDNSRLLAEMGRFEFTPFEKAVRELYDWYENNQEVFG